MALDFNSRLERGIVVTLLMLLALVNGDFSNGLNGWNAGAGWSAHKGVAVLETNGASNMCSDVVALDGARRIEGGASVKAQDTGAGYVFVGVQWFDAKGAPMWTEMLDSNEGKPSRVWHRLQFETLGPKKARGVAFCFFTNAYGGTYRARVDNVTMK